ncbi:hypothetical protein F5148DRAFT_1278832 [Russula earlei]|uniref:Uncharacterized protein n=1 Tax=Russula earlei TaxID=71964 RepID=A0ACC0UQW2_9AGAM|nr:hypothetical protein F5148DRAFT_1278832 [Russula earlei]
MFGTAVRTWSDLLFPDPPSRTSLSRVDEVAGQLRALHPTTLAPEIWAPKRLSSSAYLIKDLPKMMQEHLRDIIHQSYSEQLQRQCEEREIRITYEADSKAVAQDISRLVIDIFRSLTENRVVFLDEVLSSDSAMTKAFDKFIGELIEQMETHGLSINLCTDPTPSAYKGHKARFRGHHAGDIEPRVRWAIVLSGLHYIIAYIPPGTKGEQPRIYCSQIMRSCIPPDDEQGPQPFIWSLVVYMLLTELLNIDEETLKQRFALPLPWEDSSSPNLRSPANSAQMLIDAPQSQRVEKQHSLSISLGHSLGGGWPSMYAASNSPIIVKFAVAPRKDKAELERQLRNEKVAYIKLSPLADWVVPRLYGEFEWYGGRAIVLSYVGQPLPDLEDFMSLSPVGRVILFGELCCIHYFGVEHGDLEPRNVLRRRWSFVLKIVDFEFSNVDRSCPGWKQCHELNEVWYKLQLDRLSVIIKIRPVSSMNHRHLLFIMVVFTLLVSIMTLDVLQHWRT